METYLNDSMQYMQQIGNMQVMPQMNGMQNMYPMMDGMYGMSQMMYMQSMYQMMCMKGMYTMMGMQGMNYMYGNPMMSMDEMSSMMRMTMQFPIPRLAKLEQLSTNQIQISYDMDVDVRLGMKSTNYWIKDTINVIPQGIATLGMNDSVNAGNSHTNNKVRIDSKNGSARTFILTFNQSIPRGAEYMLIICFVTVIGTPPYSGDNGMVTFIGK